MDTKQFQDSRNAELDAFQKKYNLLKAEYSKALTDAIAQTDPGKQELLILKVEEANTNMTAELRDILTILSKGVDTFDSTVINKLTQELVQYQKEITELHDANDKITTLRLIKNTTSEKLKEASWMYFFYLGSLIFLSFVIVYFVMRTTVSSVVKSVTQTVNQ
jgi:ABC-type Na+ efflux pump permease subunit